MEAQTQNAPALPVSQPPKNDFQVLLKKYWWVGLVALLVIIIVVLIIFLISKTTSKNTQNLSDSNKTIQNQGYTPLDPNDPMANPGNGNNSGNQNQSGGYDLGDPDSTDPIEKGKALSGGNCTGQGSKTLGSAPMRGSDLSVIIPYGLLAEGHVTPIDHQYYWGKEPLVAADMYDVLAPADGKIVNIEYRDKSSMGGKVKGDYRVVITYSCTFFSYFDLATSLAPEIQAQLTPGWESRGSTLADIDVKQGQVIAKVGAQSLDFAVWDTTKYLQHLTIPRAYNNLEPWKIVTVPPLDYFSDAVKAEILPYYVNKNEPLDGTIDHDVEGTAAGGWFKIGTNGYAGIFDFSQPMTNGYWTGHFALVPNHLDSTAWMFSSGDINGKAVQYVIKNPSIAPDQLTSDDGLVKYELMSISYVDQNGQGWSNFTVADVKVANAQTVGTALVQLEESHKLKVEVFMGKTPDQVSGFTSAATEYDRGDNAVMIKSNTAY